MAFPWFPKNHKSEKGFSVKEKNNTRIRTSDASDNPFRFLDKASCLKSRNWKQMKMSNTSGHFFENPQNLTRDFYSVSEFDKTISLPVSFRIENFTFQTLKQNSFHKEKILEKGQIFNQNFRDKIRFWNKIPQRFTIWIKDFKTCQVSKLKSSKTWKFEERIFSWNQGLRESLFLKKHFLHNFSQ